MKPGHTTWDIFWQTSGGVSASDQIEQPVNTFFTGGGAHPNINVLEGFIQT